MENADDIYGYLEEFSKRKPKSIPQELNEYLAYVARTGDPVYQWPLVKSLFKEKLLNVITDFYDTTPNTDIPPYPNVDPFNYDTMKNSLIERLESFTSAPFTVQRICELLTYPRKQYNRVDKFMRAIEKNILVVSTREPGIVRQPEPENGDNAEHLVNGSDNNSEYNVDVEMEDVSWKEATEQRNSEPQPCSSDAHISVDDVETRLITKRDTPMEVQDNNAKQLESATPSDFKTGTNKTAEIKLEEAPSEVKTKIDSEQKMEIVTVPAAVDKTESDRNVEDTSNITLVIPEIKVDDTEMIEQKLDEQSMITIKEETQGDSSETENKTEIESPSITSTDDSSSDSKDEPVSKHLSEVLTSSEESSSSSDNTDGNSNSPKLDCQIDIQEESNQSDSNKEDSQEQALDIKPSMEPEKATNQVSLESDNYSISDVNSELPQPKVLNANEEPEIEKKDDPTSKEIERKATEDSEGNSKTES